MKFRIINLFLFGFIILNIACTQKSFPTVFDPEKYKSCFYSENNELEVYTWNVLKVEGCCTGKGFNGVHEIWKPNEGITRILVKSIPMNAREIQKKFCKEK